MNFIEKILLERRISIRQAARESELSRYTWHNAIHEKAHLTKLSKAKLAKYLGITFEEFDKQYTELQTKKEQ